MSDEEIMDDHYWTAQSFLKEDNPHASLKHALAALEICPTSVETLILIGEIYLFNSSKMGLLSADCDSKALDFFDRALAVESRHAGAWGYKALTQIYMDQPQAALDSIEIGFICLSERVGYAMSSDAVYTNVLESLFRCKVLALLELNRKREAQHWLLRGLDACPKSRYLTQLIDCFTPLRYVE